jgi:hypothetical protein
VSTHSRDNCPFYPGCYIGGDCDLDDWAKSTCGLYPEDKKKKQTEFWSRIRKSAAREKLKNKIVQAINRGELDDLLEK